MSPRNVSSLSHSDLPLDGGKLLFPSEPLPFVGWVHPGGTWGYDAEHEVFLEQGPRSRLRERHIHPDLFLQAAELDCGDIGSLLAFLNEHGPLGIDPTVRVDRGHAQLRSTFWNTRRGFFGLASIFSDDQDELELERRRLRAARLLRDPGALHGYEGLAALRHGVVTLRLLRDISLWMQGEGETAPPGGCSPAMAGETLAVVVDDALSVFSPRFTWQPAGERAVDARPFGDVPLFCVLCLQLARRVASGERCQHCAECNRVFYVTRRRDAEAIKRRRRDAKYCSEECRTAFHNKRRSENRQKAVDIQGR